MLTRKKQENHAAPGKLPISRASGNFFSNAGLHRWAKRKVAGVEYDADMFKLFDTHTAEVFTFNEDRKHFSAPDLVKGVPTERIVEDGSYWLKDWVSLNRWLIPPSADEVDRDRAGGKADTNTTRRNYVIHWLGPGTPMHPNQFLTKEALPKQGFCAFSASLDMSRSLQALHILKARGIISMDKETFLRWIVIEAVKNKGEAGMGCIKSIIRNIRSDGERRGYSDPAMIYADKWSRLSTGHLKEYMERFQGEKRDAPRSRETIG